MASGRGKSQRKKRDYAFHVSAQVAAGLINLYTGDWSAGRGGLTDKAYGFSYSGVTRRRTGT